jgi:hypothetical protein
MFDAFDALRLFGGSSAMRDWAGNCRVRRDWVSDWELRLVDAGVDAEGEVTSDGSLLWVVFIQSTVDIEDGTRNFVSPLP